jgi:hypothetical protein
VNTVFIGDVHFGFLKVGRGDDIARIAVNFFLVSSHGTLILAWLDGTNWLSCQVE